MSHQNRRRVVGAPPCRTIGSDDGIDPRYYFRPARDDASKDRKTRQLCAQVAQAAQLTLSGACQDPVLQSLLVVGADPAPDARRIRIRVQPTDAGDSLPFVQERLDGVAARVRAAVALAVHRKRVPQIVLQVVLPGGAQ